MNPQSPVHQRNTVTQSGDQVYARSESRYLAQCACLAQLQIPSNEEPSTEVFLANLSPHGIAYFTTDPIPVGTTVAIHFPALAASRATVCYQVCHCTKQAIGDFLIGCRIVDAELSADEVQQCLSASIGGE